ncbi:MAG: ABC transporter ATP-binding protein [Steroidobacteraceae bacterium]|jgi:iron complex transport system ATP-binding protein|nr:ABC transporter ATP-binding protein [Steroidobacteraceae bacterium]
MSDARLRLERVTVRHARAAPLVQDLTLTLEPGEVLAILGPNGRGKSSLLRCMAGLCAPSAGRVERSGLAAWLPQGPGAPFAFEARLVAVMGRLTRRGLLATPDEPDWIAADAALARLGIAHLAHRPVTELSGGERQLVWLARALAAEASLWLLDEPSAPLDLRNQVRLLALLREVAQERRALVVFTTHDPEHAREVGDRVLLLLGDGRHLEGRPVDTLTAENLRELYGVPFRRVVADDGETLLIPCFEVAR